MTTTHLAAQKAFLRHRNMRPAPPASLIQALMLHLFPYVLTRIYRHTSILLLCWLMTHCMWKMGDDSLQSFLTGLTVIMQKQEWRTHTACLYQIQTALIIWTLCWTRYSEFANIVVAKYASARQQEYIYCYIVNDIGQGKTSSRHALFIGQCILWVEYCLNICQEN